jgi:hypothetical protein
MFAITLQRDTVEIGGNVGQLSIGGLPPGVQNGSLTWVPVRGYTRKQGYQRLPIFRMKSVIISPSSLKCLT